MFSHYLSSTVVLIVFVPLLLLLNVGCLPCVEAARQGDLVTLFGVYPARAASFGSVIPDYGQFNLLLPPVGSNLSLCEYPSSLRNVSKNASLPQNNFEGDIALLVRKDCSVVRQAIHAVKLQKRFVSKLRYLIVEGLPEDGGGDLPAMLVPETDDDSSDLELQSLLKSIGILSVSYYPAAYSMRADIRWNEKNSNDHASPYLFSEHNVAWDLSGNILPYAGSGGSHYGSHSGSGLNDDSSDSFYWFRILLFAILIVSPCCRAGYLWWSGGGRFYLNRDSETGRWRVQYVPPMAHWLSQGMITGGAGPPNYAITDTLTVEEFNKLPEIEFIPPLDDSEASHNNEADVETAEMAEHPRPPAAAHPQDPNRINTIVAEGNEDATTTTTSAMTGSTATTTDSPPLSSPPLVLCSPLNQSAADSTATSNKTTTTTTTTTTNTNVPCCTTCSICIDDFEPGEKLILLPRCRHLFHRDCIQPWLTERQGCCPLCKSSVLESSEDHDNNINNNMNRQNNNNDNLQNDAPDVESALSSSSNSSSGASDSSSSSSRSTSSTGVDGSSSSDRIDSSSSSSRDTTNLSHPEAVLDASTDDDSFYQRRRQTTTP